ncbi:MAG: hypothetical protein AB7D06_08910 [Pedobacter sp.]
MKSRLPFLALILLFALTMLVVGCCTSPTADPVGAAFDRHETGLHLAVNVGVGQLLTAHPEWALPAAQIAEAVAVELETEGLVSLERLQQEVTDRIDWEGLPPAEQSLILSVVDTAAEAISRRLDESGLTDPNERKIRVAKVLRWISETARARSGTAAVKNAARGKSYQVLA